jgi:hypothetical protein
VLNHQAGSHAKYERAADGVRPRALRGHARFDLLCCFVYRNRSGRYFAECIDLDLLVEDDTPEQAWHELNDAMRGYLQAVLEPGHSTEGLLPLPSRLSRQLLYHWYVVLAAFRGRNRTFRIYDCDPSGC